MLYWRSAAALKASRSHGQMFSRTGWFHAPVTRQVAAAGLRHSRAPPDKFRQPLKFSTVQKHLVLHPGKNGWILHLNFPRLKGNMGRQ